MKVPCLILLLLLFNQFDGSLQQRTILDTFSNFFKDAILTVVGKTGTPTGIRAARKINVKKIQPIVNGSVAFPCDTTGFRSPERPTSVHRLMPGDIDVIAGMGDSLTAANGAAASRFLHVSVENRGMSWSTGGQGTWREHLTLANILKEFNPNLLGFSLEDANSHHKGAQFNVAEPGSMSKDMPYMAKVLVKRIKADKRVNIAKDWKLVTMMIGGNDFCAEICYMNDPNSAPDLHKSHLMKVLDYLQENLPRTLVNLVTPPHMGILINFKGKYTYCQAMHIVECPCIFGKARVNTRKSLMKIMRRWQQVEEDLCLDPRYQKKEDFAVVLQPFVANLVFPERITPEGNLTDWSYLSEDCFHFSQKGYARASNALWNNMLEPVGQKSTDWTDTFSRFLCPKKEWPYFYTWKTSGSNINRRQIL